MGLNRVGRFYLLDEKSLKLAIYAPDGQRIHSKTDDGQTQSLFDPDEVRMHFEQVPVSLIQPAGSATSLLFVAESKNEDWVEQDTNRQHNSSSDSAQEALSVQSLAAAPLRATVLDWTGNKIMLSPDQMFGSLPYVQNGLWISQALDS